MTMTKVRFVGDVHGKYKSYWKVVRDAEYSVQVGDMHFSYGFFKHYGLKPENHMFFGGNHDNYDIIADCPNSLGDFGTVVIPDWSHGSFFFVRGAYSIDKQIRVAHNLGWWEAEELTLEQQNAAIEAYKEAKPKIMATHDCPHSLSKVLIDQGFGIPSVSPINTRTGRMLDSMLVYHRPEIWIFGHWHISFDKVINGTRFICIPELEYLDL